LIRRERQQEAGKSRSAPAPVTIIAFDGLAHEAADLQQVRVDVDPALWSPRAVAAVDDCRRCSRHTAAGAPPG